LKQKNQVSKVSSEDEEDDDFCNISDSPRRKSSKWSGIGEQRIVNRGTVKVQNSIRKYFHKTQAVKGSNNEESKQ